MIRYVHIGNQINDDADEFAFFDTVIGRFVDIDGEQLFRSVERLREAYAGAARAWPPAEPQLERLLGLLPSQKEPAIGARASATLNERAGKALAGRWRAGMRGIVGDEQVTVLTVDVPGSSANNEDRWRLEIWRHGRKALDLVGREWVLPDMSDPATRGAYLDVVIEAWGGSLAEVTLTIASHGADLEIRRYQQEHRWQGSVGEVLVAALEATPPRAP